MGRDSRFGLAGGALLSLFSWSGNQTSHGVSVFPNIVTFAVMIVFFFGVARVQRQRLGHADVQTTVLRILPVGLVSGLVLAAAMTALAMTRFRSFRWTLSGFGALGAFVSCVVWAVLVAAASGMMNRRSIAAP